MWGGADKPNLFVKRKALRHMQIKGGKEKQTQGMRGGKSTSHKAQGRTCYKMGLFMKCLKFRRKKGGKDFYPKTEAEKRKG